MHQSLCVRSTSLAEDARQLLAFLERQQTFHFPSLKTGLFSAAAGAGTEFELTGYRSVWVRDNVHIAHAHLVWDEPGRAVAAMSAVMNYFLRHRHRFTDAITGRSDYGDPMQRPHIRFDGDTLTELNEKWSHAQNDALGGFLWLYCKLASLGHIKPGRDETALLAELASFLGVIQYWQDEDSGHWEEVRKVAASSIGVATAGLIEYRNWLIAGETGSSSSHIALVEQLIGKGKTALNAILPHECRQENPQQRRSHDAALLFLIYPYRVVDDDAAAAIVRGVTATLQGEHGIRRYVGDSYWCADYKEKLAADQRTVDFSDNLADRDRLLQPGLEAQWCLFDPIVSIHYGLIHKRTGAQAALQQQVVHLNRSLSQLTGPESRFGPYRCPESYYCERGRYVPNDICPLLWTQANLKLALLTAATS